MLYLQKLILFSSFFFFYFILFFLSCAGSFLWKSRDLPGIWGRPRGENALDGGAAFYDVYETQDGKFMSVGALEPQFSQALLQGMSFVSVDLNYTIVITLSIHGSGKLYATVKHRWPSVSVFGIGFLVRVFLLLGRLSHQG
jgi:hypothetical protein